jgi:thymidylate kinase
MRGLILEGIVGSGKSSVLRSLKKQLTEQDGSSMVLSEHITERPMEPLRSANLEKSLSHLGQLVCLIKQINDIEQSVQKYPYPSVQFILERFHFSHCLDIAGFEKFDAFVEIDRQMESLGSKLVVLTLHEKLILDRSIVSTKKTRTEAWAKYLAQIADSDEGAAGYYKKQQDDFVSLCEKSEIPSMVVDTSNRDWDEVSFQVIDFLNRA